MKIDWKKLLIALLIPLSAGALSGLLSGDAMASFEQLKQPPLSPPGIVFPIVWNILYALMGVSTYLIVQSNASHQEKREALSIYVLQLIFNALWSFFFFGTGAYLFAFVWLCALWLLIVWMIKRFTPISSLAAWLQVPYLLWVSFAGYLNLAIPLLN